MTKERRATLVEVARASGVHFGTASRALDPTKAHLVSASTRERVQQTASRLGYRANLSARALIKGQTSTIGFAAADLGNPFVPPILRAAEEQFDLAGYSVLISETRDTSEGLHESIEKLLSRDVDGLIISAARLTDLPFIRKVAIDCPTVLAIREVGDSKIISVSHDDFLGGRIAADHLVGLGHRALAEIRGPSDISSFRERSRGFRAVIRSQSLLNLSNRRKSFSPTIEGGIEGARLLLESEEMPSGIFAHNDLLAIGAIEELERQGLSCPRDVSVIGYNDAPLTDRLSPPLSTIRLAGGKVGTLAACRLIDLISGQQVEPVTERLPPELVPRGSSGPFVVR